MKTRNTSFLFFAALICGLLLTACGSGKPEIVQVDPAFSQYISAYSSGMQSRTANVRIQLEDVYNDDVLASIKRDSLGMPDSTLLKNIFSFEPEIAGHAIWVDNHTVEFIPDEVLPVNQFFDVHFDLERLAKVKDGYDDFHFQFATYHQDLFVEVDGLYDSGDYDLDWKRLRGTIRTTDFEDTALFRRTLKIVQNGKSLRYTLESGYDEYQYIFEVDSIERKEQAGKVTVSWDGAAIKAFKSGHEDLDIPALGDFSVSNAKVMDNGDQYVELQFSEPIAQQYLDGIVTLDGVDKLTYTISYNLVTVYLPNRLVGTHKLSVTDGVRNIKGQHMLQAYSNDLLFEEPKPLVRIKGNGSILPSSNGLIFPFEAISLKAVDVRIVKIYENNIHHFLQVNNLDGDDNLTRFGKVIVKKKIALDYDKSMDLKQWNSHVIDLNKLIKADPGAIYRVSIKFSKEYAICDCPVDENATAETDESGNGSYEDVDPEWNENTWQGYGFDDGFDSWYSYGDDYSACDNYYYEGKAVSRNILASDLGVIFKLDEDRLSHAFVSDLITTNPVQNATIEYFDFTKQLIASGTTDANGMLDLQLKQKPFLMITKHGSQRGYMKLGDGYTNSLSEFDIEGETVQNGVKGFIYGERGVWRPGDSLYLTFILQDLLHKLPANHPVKFELQDPNGQTVYETTKVKHVNSMYDFRTATSDNAPTGDYTALVRVGNRVFTKTLRVETVKPNRLKIYMNVENGVTGDSTKLSVKWLHGAPAKHLRATVSVKVNPMQTTFPNYKSYVFDSPMRSCKSDVEQVFEGYLDDKGESWVNTRLNSVSYAPGMLRAHYITRVYEEGGDFSIDRSSVNYSPFKTYVGMRVPEPTHGDGSLETDQNHKIDIVAVNEKGAPVTANNLQVKVYKLQWRWWYEQDDEDLAEYMARTGTIVIEDTTVSAKNGKATFNFRIKAPEYGRYLVTVTDPTGEHQTGQIITVDLPYWNRGNRMDNEHANMLSFSCDKQTYVKGEHIQLSFPSPADGHALVSVETSRKVVQKFWIKTVKGETKYEFPATAEMSPNAFIHVTMIQPHATTKNDLPIRMYGVVPVMVDDPETHIHPEIAMADAVRPESIVSVKVSEQNGRKMTYTLEIVDDGLLDLTAFKTPQPWTTFYAREALGVPTWDMYDHVIGAYAGKLDKLLSIGGDGDLDGAKGPKANRFKPMVIHLGPFELEPGQTQTHKVEIPNYVGSVRVMVVAHNEGAYGNAEKTVAVKKPLMVLATLPRVLGPGEQVQLPVDVFAMEKQIKDVKVTVEVNDMLVLSGAKQQAITFTQIGDQVLNFKLNVAERIGIAKVKVTAVCGSETAVQEIELDVRAPNPTVFEGKEMVLEPGREWNTDLYFKGMIGTNKATIEFSSVPSMGLEKRLNYLLEYPHGCIEQTTSAAFPQLYVNRLMDLNEQQQLRSSENIKAALRRLQLFQTSDGGFSYWPGESDESEWGTNYAGHFLVEAEQQGYSLPGNLKARWVKYEQQMARNYDPANGVWAENTTEIIQAYRLFVLALSKNPEAGAMNRLREVRNLSATAKWRLAAAYELIGQKEVAQKLTDQLPTSVAAYKELSYTYGSDTRDQAMILETLSLMGNKTRTGNLAKEIAAKLSSDQWMSTQETAYSLLAMCEYAGVKTGRSALNFSCSVNGAAVKKGTTTKSIYQVGYTDKDFAKRGSLACKNTGNSTLFVKVMVQGTPLVGDQSSAAKDLVLKLKFRDMNGKEIKPDKLAQGTDFTAEVTITNPGKKGWYKEMALTQIFPSGWEIHNARMDGGGYSTAARYEDIRDDRVYSYYDLGPNESKTFRVQLNATYLGRFYLPTTYSDAMYDHWISARVPGKWVEVFKEKS